MTQSQSSMITDEMRAGIGRESEPATYEVDNLGCRQFARSVGYTNAIYYDDTAAKAKGYRGLVAPVGFLGHPIYSPNRPPRGPESLGLNIPLKRVLNGGTDYEYFDTVCAGDTLTATSRVTDISEREGRMGPMVIVNMQTDYRRDGKTVAILRGTVIRY